ncbi:MAG: hypothetical protein LBC98_10825 [Prevotellaceae bacterium]|jgi:hypothetical protein|nr:hypothetical protein [Prevotellaceae bacterium]
MKKRFFKSKMETENHSNGARPKSHTSRKMFLVQMLAILCLLFSGCSKDKNDDDDDGGGTSGTAELDNAIYSMKYAIQVAADYNDRQQKPSSISAGGKTVASIKYQPNGLLGYMEFPQSSAKLIATFHSDAGRRPSTICKVNNPDDAVTYSTIKNENYNFDTNPANLLACFVDYGTYNGDLNIVINNNMGAEVGGKVVGGIRTKKNCYKMVVYGKNKAGKVIGIYVGYVEGTSFHYWDINPDSSSFGKSGSKTF